MQYVYRLIYCRPAINANAMIHQDLMVFGINFNLITIRVHQQSRIEDSTRTLTTVRFASSGPERGAQRTEARNSKVDSFVGTQLSDLELKKEHSSELSTVTLAESGSMV